VPLSRAGYCDEGCYWECEHRTSGRSTHERAASEEAPSPRKQGWRLGPGGEDDPEQLAFDDWRLYSIAGVPMDELPSRQVRTLKYCTECASSFSDATEHSREHERLRQLGHDSSDGLDEDL